MQPKGRLFRVCALPDEEVIQADCKQKEELSGLQFDGVGTGAEIESSDKVSETKRRERDSRI